MHANQDLPYENQVLSSTEGSTETGGLVGQLEAKGCLRVAHSFVRHHEVEEVCQLRKRLKSLFPPGSASSHAGMTDR